MADSTTTLSGGFQQSNVYPHRVRSSSEAISNSKQTLEMAAEGSLSMIDGLGLKTSDSIEIHKKHRNEWLSYSTNSKYGSLTPQASVILLPTQVPFNILLKLRSLHPLGFHHPISVNPIPMVTAQPSSLQIYRM